jgi:hypothetical protein
LGVVAWDLEEPGPPGAAPDEGSRAAQIAASKHMAEVRGRVGEGVVLARGCML